MERGDQDKRFYAPCFATLCVLGRHNPSKKESKRVRSEKAKGEGIGLRDQRSPGCYEEQSSTLEKPLWLRLVKRCGLSSRAHERNGEDGSI